MDGGMLNRWMDGWIAGRMNGWMTQFPSSDFAQDSECSRDNIPGLTETTCQ